VFGYHIHTVSLLPGLWLCNHVLSS